MATDPIVVKAKRRIKRFIKTGEHVARVRAVGDNVYSYTVKHHYAVLRFKKDKLGRLRKVTT